MLAALCVDNLAECVSRRAGSSSPESTLTHSARLATLPAGQTTFSAWFAVQAGV